MAGTLGRSYSDKFIPGMSDYDLHQNRNQDWTRGPFTKIFYVIFVILSWFLFHISRLFTPGDCWTATNISHFVITFIIFHWVRGSPDESTQGEYNSFTLYEQIDAGVPWTTTKKFLMLVPTVLTWLACHFAHYEPIYVFVNCGIFLICIIAKIPEMHRVRIFGINANAEFIPSVPSQDALDSPKPTRANAQKKKSK